MPSNLRIGTRPAYLKFMSVNIEEINIFGRDEEVLKGDESRT